MIEIIKEDYYNTSKPKVSTDLLKSIDGVTEVTNGGYNGYDAIIKYDGYELDRADVELFMWENFKSMYEFMGDMDQEEIDWKFNYYCEKTAKENLEDYLDFCGYR